MQATIQVLSEAVAAEELGLSARTLQRWRVVGGGPTYIKLGKRVVYRLEDLNDFLTRQRRTSTSDAVTP